MHITITMVVTYIVLCVWIRTPPWRYFQLNARYFNDERGIFSKLGLDALVPPRWRLRQSVISADAEPASYPVFLKPEWGQNSHGIMRADTPEDFGRLRATLSSRPQRYLIQEAAPGTREFEIFSIDAHGRHPGGGRRHDVLTVTEAVNPSERFPINSKFNRDTRYVEITDAFDEAGLATLSAHLDRIGRFGITRMSVRSDSREALLDGDFHVIEINLFVPMPINLLDARYTTRERWRFIRRAMMALALATKAIDPAQKRSAVFTRMMLYGRRRSLS